MQFNVSETTILRSSCQVHDETSWKMPMITVAACQLTPVQDFSLKKEQLRRWLARLEASHVDFVCFPEGFLTGYHADEAMAREEALEVGKELFCEWL